MVLPRYKHFVVVPVIAGVLRDIAAHEDDLLKFVHHEESDRNKCKSAYRHPSLPGSCIVSFLHVISWYGSAG